MRRGFQFAGYHGTDASVRRRVAGLGPLLLDERGVRLVGFADIGRSAGGTIVAICGRLLDPVALRARLPDSAAHTVADLVAEAYDHLGRRALRELRGEYAIVLLPGGTDGVIVANDALGASPLMLATVSGGSVFAREIRDVLDILPAQPAISPLAVGFWAAQSSYRAGASFFEGIERMPAGTIHTIGRPVSERMSTAFSQPTASEMITDPDEADALMNDALAAAAQRATEATSGRFGVLLSGGLDSTTMAALAVRAVGKENVVGVSGLFPGLSEADESFLIEDTVDTLGIESVRTVIDGSTLWKSWAGHPAEWKLPVPSPVAFIVEELLRAAGNAGIDTVLTGQGGDELFYAHPNAYLLDLLRSGRLVSARRYAGRLPNLAPGRRAPWRALRWSIKMGRQPRDQGATDSIRLVRPELQPDIMAMRRAVDWISGTGPMWWRQREWTFGALHELLDPGGVIRRLSVESGVRQIHPFWHDLDLHLACLRLHPTLMFDPRDRVVTRRVMAGLLPDSVLWRRGKSHFTQLPANWLSGPGRDTPQRILGGRDVLVFDYLDAAAIRHRLLHDDAAKTHPDGLYGWAMELFRTIALELWLRDLAGLPNES